MSSKPRMPAAPARRCKRIVAGATLVAFLATPPYATAALTEISNAPLASASTAQIPPNVMFVLDDSGSMDSTYMPDSASAYNGDVGGKSHLCNTIYYNPGNTYFPPKNADGTDFPDASFTGARLDGFSSNSPSGSVNLSTSFTPNGSSASEPAYYYRWKAGDATALAEWEGLTALQKDAECDTDDGTSSGGSPAAANPGNWVKVPITTATEQQNFANWHAYYRTRLMTMKSAAGRAFATLNDSFRVGFITICPNDSSSCGSATNNITVAANKYLRIDNFTPSHKQAWFDMFYAQRAHSWTPLREALSRVGRHYAGITSGINSGMNDDPVQFSCQQNFAILTTDGYWNYGQGQRIDSSTMGNEDANLGLTPRPMYDSGTVSTVTTQEFYEDVEAAGAWPCNASQRRADRHQRTLTTNQTGYTTTSSWSQTNNNACFPTATIDNAIASGCGTTSQVSPGSSTTGCDAGTTTATSASVGNTLADVAEYYYRNDLRPAGSTNTNGDDVSDNNVPQAGTDPEDDTAQHQHMTTFTLGMGLSGQLDFQPDYKDGTGAFAGLRDGTLGWPNPNPSVLNPSSTSPDSAARIDDLWHAAVNGRGQAFSASDPTSLAVSLQTALSAIQVRLASAAAAATSSLEPTLTDRLVFTPLYTTGEWAGELQAREIDLATGMVLPGVVWSAQSKLDLRAKAACDTRKIHLHRPNWGSTNLVDFAWDTMSCDGAGNPTGSPVTGLDATEQAFFGATQTASFTQWGLMTDGTNETADQRTPAAGANLVNFVRGQRGLEDFTPNDASRLYRKRTHVLGDIVNSQPVYVRDPFFDYTDTGYDAFKTAINSSNGGLGRVPLVFAAANDGMLHAFYAGRSVSDPQGGEEAWAFVPRAVLSRLHRLADTNWAQMHEYSVDATPSAGDVYDTASGSWKTILVAGLNKGGRAYYALDVTDPANPVALWEFANDGVCFGPTNRYSDCDLGYSYGNPVISKLENGRWVVFVTSGYNNVSPGDGKGYLYVLDAMTGEILYKIGTGAGDATTPSGLAKIRNWVSGNAAQNNTTARVYGTDLLGNVWRFDVNDSVDSGGNPIMAPLGREAQLLTAVKDGNGNPQPITVRPELAEVGSPPVPFVYVATGRYLGPTDVTDTQVQSLYAIKDPLTQTPVSTNLRADLKRLDMSTNGTDRFVTCDQSSGNCSSPLGWYVDFMDAGERVNVEMKLQLGTLVVASNVPGNTACAPGGYSYKNFFDYATGLSPAGATQPIGSRLSNALAVGINVIRLPDGRIVVIGMDSSGTPTTFEAPIASGAPTGKRITWREISQ
ncbi:MAG: PilC/PilY family type IV pilus protein [Burkholderiales bacterium]|nr:PilC/PilY family type IV pilus protein [Burkholderiales bacterium]